MKKKLMFLVTSVFQLGYSALAKADQDIKIDSNSFELADVALRAKQRSEGNLVLEILANNGVFIDDLSQIVTHEEKSHIDITCFNCIIVNKHFSEKTQPPRNDIVDIRYDQTIKVLNDSRK